MALMDQMNDHQNMTMTQFSYCSNMLTKYEGMTFGQIEKALRQKKTSLNAEEKRFLSLMEEHTVTPGGPETRYNYFDDMKLVGVRTNIASGFGAIAVEDPSGNTGISYRGSDPFWDGEGNELSDLQDWLDDAIAASIGGSVQNAEALAFFEAYKNKDGNNYLYGHSKGGQLSEMVYVENLDQIKEIHLLNPQPVNPYILTPGQVAALRSNKVDIVVVEGDYVWCLGLVVNGNRVRVVKRKDGKGLLDAHLYGSALFDSNGAIVPGQLSVWETGLNMLEGYVVHKVQQVFGFMVFSGAMLYRIVVKGLIPMVGAFIDGCASLLKKTFDIAMDGIKAFVSFLENLANNVQTWLNQTFNPGYRYAEAHTSLRVNTNSLQLYADRLDLINRRLRRLDQRIDDLYGKVGLLDLWDLMQADLLTGYSWRISRCISYLRDTASDFEATERQVTGYL